MPLSLNNMFTDLLDLYGTLLKLCENNYYIHIENKFLNYFIHCYTLKNIPMSKGESNIKFTIQTDTFGVVDNADLKNMGEEKWREKGRRPCLTGLA